eukprot:3001215-Alexandrium_andersonii.AAC.1
MVSLATSFSVGSADAWSEHAARLATERSEQPLGQDPPDDADSEVVCQAWVDALAEALAADA